MRDVDKIHMNRDEAWLCGVLAGIGVTFLVWITVSLLQAPAATASEVVEMALGLGLSISVLALGIGFEAYRRLRNR